MTHTQHRSIKKLRSHLPNLVGLLLALSMIAIGCSGGGDGGGGFPFAVQTGTFTDSRVKGIAYKTRTRSGVTDEKGRFKYRKGEAIEFSVGDIPLGTKTVAKPSMTPVDLVMDAVGETHPAVVNICRFLQSLDEDRDIDDLITISSKIQEELKGRPPIDFTQAPESFSDDYGVKSLFEVLNLTHAFPREDRTLCDPAQAVEHLRKNLWHKKKTIIVKSPNGGELLIPGGTFEITWKASSSIENVKIILSSDSGESYVDLIELFAPNTGSYNWDFIPATWVGATNRIRILDAVDSDVYDHSNRDFSILNRPESPITLLMPNGGETWVAGTSREITWTALPTIEHVKIELLLLDGNQEPEPVVIAQSTRNDGVFVWNSIPVEYVGKFCRVIVSDAGDPALYDESDASLLFCGLRFTS